MAVFERSDSTWTERPFPLLDYTPLELALAAHGRTAAVARQGTQADPCGCRAVVVYDRNDAGVWSAVAVLRSNKRLDTVGSANDDGFGHAGATTRSLALNGDGTVVAVGASLDSSDANDAVGDPDNHSAPNSGAIYVFQRQADNTFAMQAFVKAKGAVSFDRFGHSVALNRSGVVLSGGARSWRPTCPASRAATVRRSALPAATPAPNGALTGAGAYTFERTGNAWVHKAKIVAPNADSAHFSSLHGMAVVTATRSCSVPARRALPAAWRVALRLLTTRCQQQRFVMPRASDWGRDRCSATRCRFGAPPNVVAAWAA